VADAVWSLNSVGRTPEMDDEYRKRKAANLAWIHSGFAIAKAKGSRGIVLLAQADPGFENYWPPAAKARYLRSIPGAKLPDQPVPTAFEDYIRTLADELENFDKSGCVFARRYSLVSHRPASLQREGQSPFRKLHARPRPSAILTRIGCV
jgi:hypothetical protein